MHTVLVVIAVIAIIGFVIGRQLLGEPLRGKRLIVLPAILTVIGVLDLGKDGRHPLPSDIAFIALSGVIAAGIGLGQAAMMRLENRNGGLWGQMPVKSLWLWAALVVSRVIVGVIANAAGAQVAASTASVLLILGINRLAQAALIAPRAIRAGIPFAPEKDGSTFLSGMTAPAAANRPEAAPTRPAATGSKDSGSSVAAAGQQLFVALGGAWQDRRNQRQQERDNDRGRRDRRR